MTNHSHSRTIVPVRQGNLIDEAEETPISRNGRKDVAENVAIHLVNFRRAEETSTSKRNRAVIRGEVRASPRRKKGRFCRPILKRPSRWNFRDCSWLARLLKPMGCRQQPAGEVSFRFGEFIRAETSLLSLYSSTTIPTILLAWETHRTGTA